jgi:hypothetical protein
VEKKYYFFGKIVFLDSTTISIKFTIVYSGVPVLAGTPLINKPKTRALSRITVFSPDGSRFE